MRLLKADLVCWAPLHLLFHFVSFFVLIIIESLYTSFISSMNLEIFCYCTNALTWGRNHPTKTFSQNAFFFQTYTHFLSVTSHLLRRLIMFRIIVWVLGTLCQIWGFSALAWVSHLELKKISSPGPINSIKAEALEMGCRINILKLPWWLQYPPGLNSPS